MEARTAVLTMDQSKFKAILTSSLDLGAISLRYSTILHWSNSVDLQHDMNYDEKKGGESTCLSLNLDSFPHTFHCHSICNAPTPKWNKFQGFLSHMHLHHKKILPLNKSGLIAACASI
jgi:hypothetical protein